MAGSAADVADRALPGLVAGTFLVGVVLAAVLTFLAVLLLLAATRAERTQLAIRLRTAGLTNLVRDLAAVRPDLRRAA